MSQPNLVINPDAVKQMASAYKRMQETVSKTLLDLQAAIARRSERNPDFAEAMSVAQYKRRIEQERALGLGYVRRQATRVREELGLDEDTRRG